MFGEGAAEELAYEMGIPFLGAVNLRPDYLDALEPPVLTNDEVSSEFDYIALGVTKTAVRLVATGHRDRAAMQHGEVT